MPRAAAAAVLTAVLAVVAPASADDGKPADAERVRTAAEDFDAGAAAFKARDYEGAAAHFEAADAAVPSAKTLRLAIRARGEAGQGARAATLAALALARNGGDDATVKVARETLEKLAPLLHKATVTCASPCVLSVDGRAVLGEASARWTVYLDPGDALLTAKLASGTRMTKTVAATAGGSGEVRFAPEGQLVPPVSAAGPDTPSKAELPPEEPKKEDPPPPEAKGISPVFFGVGAGVTAVLGATLVWSGVDTVNNPGTAAVMAACQGKGTSCPLYQTALGKQVRTDAFIGATAGAAAITVALAIFTRWGGAKKPPPAEPTAFLTDRGAAIGAAGAF